MWSDLVSTKTNIPAKTNNANGISISVISAI